MRILLTVAVLALFFAALIYWSGPEAGSGPSALDTQPPSALPDPVRSARIDTAPPTESEPSAGRVPPAPETGTSPAGADATDVELLVLELGSGRPVAGATVRALPFAYLMRFTEEHPSETLDIEDVHAGVVERVTDAEGRARLPRGVLPGQCCARKGPLYGMQWLQEEQAPPLRLGVGRDRSFALQVVDGNGHPVEGVPVALSPVGSELEGEALWSGMTRGADGLAVVRHIDQLVARYAPQTVLAARTAILARAGEVLDARVDLELLPVVPVRLVLPPCGSVEVLLRGPRGEPAHSRSVSLADANEADEQGDLSFMANTFSPARVELGRASFPFVGVGLALHVTAFGGSKMAARKVGPGPVRDGERVTFAIDFDEALPRFAGRVLHPGDTPFEGRMLQATFEGAFGRSGQPVTTDEAGRLEFWSPFPSSMLARGMLRIAGTSGRQELQAAVLLPDPFPGGGFDLGDVRLAVPVALARGRVVDDLGAPVGSALFNVQSETVVDGSARWGNELRIEPITLELGGFELRGAWGGGPLRISATRGGHVSAAPVEFTLPCGEIRIVLERAASIPGRMLLDAGVLPADLRIRVVRRAALVPELVRVEGVQGASISADGSFVIPEVRPGRVDLHFILRDAPEPFFVLEDLALLPGERATDGRLFSIDLRGRVPAKGSPR